MSTSMRGEPARTTPPASTLVQPRRDPGIGGCRRFIAHDRSPQGETDAVRRRFSLRILEDVGITGFDDIEEAGWAFCDLTTFRQPVGDIASWTVRVIAEGVETDGEASRVFEAPLVWRSSVRRPVGA